VARVVLKIILIISSPMGTEYQGQLKIQIIIIIYEMNCKSIYGSHRMTSQHGTAYTNGTSR